jgi:hypothetical protein
MRRSCIGLRVFLQWALSTYLYPGLEGSYHIRTHASRSDQLTEFPPIRITIRTCLTNYSHFLTNFIFSLLYLQRIHRDSSSIGSRHYAIMTLPCVHGCPRGRSLPIFSSPACFILVGHCKWNISY